VTDFQSLWQQVEAIPHPGDAPQLKERPIALSLEAQFCRGFLFTRGIALSLAWGGFALLIFHLFVPANPIDIRWAIAAMVINAVFFVKLIPADMEAFQNRFDRAANLWKHSQESWERCAGPRSFEAKKMLLSHHRRDWDNLPNVRASRIEELKRKHWHSQLLKFLSTFPVDRIKAYHVAALHNVNLSRIGIKTAADVTPDRIRILPTIGELIGDDLLQWRYALEAKFELDPHHAIDPHGIVVIDKVICAERWELELKLKKELADFRQIILQTEEARVHKVEQFEDQYHAYRQARADLAALVGTKAVKVSSQPAFGVRETDWAPSLKWRRFSKRCKDSVKVVVSYLPRF
jgi:DNA-binding helix-hairpin-helix protein with protein kinase domain